MKDIQKASNSHSTTMKSAYKKIAALLLLEKTPE